MVKPGTSAIHLAAFVNQPVATPHQPRYAQQLPPGGSQEEVAGAGTIQFTHLFRKQQAAFEPPLQVRGKPVVRCVMNSHKILSYNPPLDKRCKICYLEAATEQYLQGGAKFPTGGDSPRTHLRRIGEIPIPTV